jgi:hypothetical protein
VTLSIKISELAIGLSRCGGVVTSVPRTAVDTLDQAAIRVPIKRACTPRAYYISREFFSVCSYFPEKGGMG